jgi:hypothetical protein
MHDRRHTATRQSQRTLRFGVLTLAVLLSVAASGSVPVGGVTVIRLVGTGSGDALPEAGPGRTVEGAGSKASGFTIHGSVKGLFPGAIRPMTLTVTNPKKSGIIVEKVSTRVSSASPTCGSKYVTVSAYSGHLKVTRRHSAELGVRVTMRHSAPNACQGVVFGFAYSGRAVTS